jgi:hypothetical protein
MKSDNAIKIGLIFNGKAPTATEWKWHGDRVAIPWQEPAEMDRIRTGQTPISLLSFLPGSKVDQKRWPEPAHQAFVNLDLGSHTRIEVFLRTYGMSPRFFEDLIPVEGKVLLSVEKLCELQEELRRDWQAVGRLGGRLQSRVNLLSSLPPTLDLRTQPGRLSIITNDLWVLIDLGWRLDLARGLVGYCKLPDCKQLPYFIKPRSDAEFCGGHCRSVFHMRERRTDPRKREIDNARRRKGKKKRSRDRATHATRTA